MQNDLHAGGRHVQLAMDRVEALYNQRKAYVPAGTDAWVVCAVYKRVVALPDQKKVIETNIERMGLSPFASILYIASNSDDPNTFPGKGTVLVDGRAAKPRVYVEDRVVSQG
jgi:hypothetical protein